MAIQSLTPPQDITWTRLAFSRDMIDTNFDDMAFRPKWRSSLSVYHYVVPDEETADAYPNSRIVYLKLTCSITGWNPSEDLRFASEVAQESGTWDDLQRTLWEVVLASGWASKYWPCLGAIMQLAVYPNSPAGVAPDDYPYIMDFEPKKRELYESVTEGAEVLSGSAEKTSLTKGSTSVSSTSYGGGGGFSMFGIGVSASVNCSSSDTTVHQNQTDTSKEARETLSRTTSTSQMYQLFNGYHLGTNRALFVVAPRPHTVSSESQTEFNLIDGERKLEGIQDVFVVVHLPRSMDGFCIQASLDTGHHATTTVPHMVLMKPVDDNDPTNDPLPLPDPPTPPPPTAPIRQLVITRRLIQACGVFDENGALHLRQLTERKPPLVVGELGLPMSTTAMLRPPGGSTEKTMRSQVANNLNALQSRVNRLMLDNASSGSYEPRAFEQSGVFKALVGQAARSTNIRLSDLADKGYLSRTTLAELEVSKIFTLADLFNPTPAAIAAPNAHETRKQLVEGLLGGGKR